MRRARALPAAAAAVIATLICAASAAAASYPETVLRDGASPYLRLDETAGPIAADASPAHRDATYNGAVTFGRPGAVDGTAITLDGQTAYLQANDTQEAPNRFTLEVWVRTTSAHGGWLAGFANAGSRDRILYLDRTGRLVFGIYPGATVTISTSGAFNDGEWHLAHASLGPSGAQLYVDGRKEAENPYEDAGAAYAGAWRFGGGSLGGWPNADAHFLQGDLDEVAVYPTQLSAEQIAAHYRAAGRTPATRPPAEMTVDQAPQQTMNGFGVNGDWWTIDLNNFPRDVQRQVANLLFSESGIRLSRYRYNIGGGGVGVTQFPTGATEIGPLQRAPRSFFQGLGIYDWSVDPGGIRFLRWATEAGVPTIHAHVNSAPWYFTTNGQSCGGTLRADRVDAYAEYIATVVEQVERRFDATIDYVSPMNEPSYTRADCTQEGMAIAPTDRGQVLQAVHRALEARAPFAGTVGDESTGMGVFAREAPQWLADPASANAVEALAVHTYDNPSAATRNAARDVARQHDKPLWSTEICCNVTGANNYGKLYDPSMVDGQWMANTIASDILDAGASAFDWWQAVSGALGCDPTQDAGCPERAHFGKDAYNDGLLYINPRYGSQDDHRFWITKRFYVLGQFSRFVRPGAIRHDVAGTPPHIRALAFQNGRDWQLVVLDNDPPGVSGTEVRLRLPAGRLKAGAAYQTSETRSLERVDPARVQPDGTVVAHVPAQSVTTFTLRGE